VHGILAFCWPYRNEYDPRHLAAALRRRGARTALPVVVAPKTPLIFREWHPGVKLAEGPLAIPYPRVRLRCFPITCAAMLGWDAKGYRLGYGGGSRSHARRDEEASARHRRVIRVPRICERFIRSPYDIPVDSSSPSAACTGASLKPQVPRQPAGLLSPACYAVRSLPIISARSRRPSPETGGRRDCGFRPRTDTRAGSEPLEFAHLVARHLHADQHPAVSLP